MKDLLFLPGSVDINIINDVQQNLWLEIKKKFQIDKEDPETWFQNEFNPAGNSSSRRLNGMNSVMEILKKNENFCELEKILKETINTQINSRYTPIEKWYSLISFPGTNTKWNVPHKSWHIDEPISAKYNQPKKYFVFVFLNKVTLDMGPTMAIKGSKAFGIKYLNEIGITDKNIIKAFELDLDETERLLSPSNAFNQLKTKSNWLNDLSKDGESKIRKNKFMKKKSDDNLQVQALLGEPGDIIIMDPGTLHSVSSNVSNLPREIIRLDFSLS